MSFNNTYDGIRTEYILNKQKYPIDKIKQILSTGPNYIVIYEGMGCSTIVRRFDAKSKIEALFYHSDDWMDENKKKMYNDFINGYTLIELNNLMIHEL
jgi:hypothetical protein